MFSARRTVVSLCINLHALIKKKVFRCGFRNVLIYVIYVHNDNILEGNLLLGSLSRVIVLGSLLWPMIEATMGYCPS